MLPIHQLECTRFLENVSQVFILVFKKLFLDVVGPQADHILVFEAILQLVAEAAVHCRVSQLGYELVNALAFVLRNRSKA